MLRRLLLLALAAALGGCAHRAEPLFAEGSWSAPVWIPEQPDFEEFVAAQELADWAAIVTGRRPEVRREGAAPARAGIALGRTRAAAALGAVPPQGDGDAATRLSRGALVVVVGNSPAATRMAAARLCEQALGITFVMPGLAGADWVPLARVERPPDEVWRPAIAWRSISGLTNSEAVAWARAHGYGSRPRSTHGLHLAFNSELFASRPELFPGPDGQPAAPAARGRSFQPDLAHPDSPGLAAAAARRWLQANPDELAVPLGINDSVVWPPGPAHWPGNRLWDGRPDRSDLAFGFLNRVAAGEWNPGGDRALGALAYLDAAPAPSIRVHPAVFPAVCADRIQYANSAYARLESDNLSAWGRSGVRRLATWDYWFGKDVPFPRFHSPALAASIAAAHRAGVDSWYAEVEPLWTFDAPKLWIGAKLLADPAADPAALERAWFAAAYGPAAEPMRQLFAACAARWEAAFADRLDGEWLRGWRDGALGLPGLDDLLAREAPALLSRAEAALAAAPEDLRHRRMRSRLAQFRLAWDAVVAQRARARLADLAASPAPASRPSLADMLAAEARRDAAVAALNARIWPGSERVTWPDFAEANPWPLLVRGDESLPSSAPLAARLASAAHRLSRADPSGLLASWTAQGDPAGQGWTLWLAPPSRLLADSAPANSLGVVSPQGRIHRRVQARPSDIIEVVVDVAGATAAQPGSALLSVRFPSSAAAKAPPAPPPLHPAPKPDSRRALPSVTRLVQGSNVLLVPVAPDSGEVAEIEISFVDRLPDLRQITVRRLSSR